MAERVLIYGTVNPADRGGVQSVCNRLARALEARGHFVEQAWPSANPGREGRDAAWPLPPLIWRHGMPAPRSSAEASLALIKLGRALARLRPTVVNVHFVTAAAMYFALLKRAFRYRLVLSVHGSDVLRPQADDEPWLAPVFRRADAVTAVSSLTASRVRAMPSVRAESVHPIPNGIDEEFWSAAALPGGDGDGQSVLSVGRLDPVKGHDILLRAFPRILARVPDARLTIVGEGGYRRSLEQLAREAGVGEPVDFAGDLPATGVRERLRAARVFVLPSRSEGLPLTLLEAMAAGVPVVAADVGGVPEILTPGTGRLVPPEDPTALGDAVSELLESRPIRDALRPRARERARRFSAKSADAAYEAVLTATAQPVAAGRQP